MFGTHLHSGQVASMASSKPAVSGALVDINILQINVHSHHAPARQEDTINPALEVLRMSMQMMDTAVSLVVFSGSLDINEL